MSTPATQTQDEIDRQTWLRLLREILPTGTQYELYAIERVYEINGRLYGPCGAASVPGVEGIDGDDACATTESGLTPAPAVRACRAPAPFRSPYRTNDLPVYCYELSRFVDAWGQVIPDPKCAVPCEGHYLDATRVYRERLMLQFPAWREIPGMVEATPLNPWVRQHMARLEYRDDAELCALYEWR